VCKNGTNVGWKSRAQLAHGYDIRHHVPVFQLILPFLLELPFDRRSGAAAEDGNATSEAASGSHAVEEGTAADSERPPKKRRRRSARAADAARDGHATQLLSNVAE
jgi:hypothetical protein